MNQTENMQLEQFINAKEPFEIFYNTGNNHYIYVRSYYLVPSDCYNEFIFCYRNCRTIKKRIKKLKKLLLNKLLIIWDFCSHKYICTTIKNIIEDPNIFCLNYVLEDNRTEIIHHSLTSPMDLRYINNLNK